MNSWKILNWIELKQIVEWKCEPIFHVQFSINALDGYFDCIHLLQNDDPVNDLFCNISIRDWIIIIELFSGKKLIRIEKNEHCNISEEEKIWNWINLFYAYAFLGKRKCSEIWEIFDFQFIYLFRTSGWTLSMQILCFYLLFSISHIKSLKSISVLFDSI